MLMAAPRIAFEAIGTRWEIIFAQDLTPAQEHTLSAQINDRIELFDKAYSRFRADSLVTQMAAQAGAYTLPADGPKLLAWYQTLYVATGGRVTPLIGQTMADAGYDATYSFRPQPLHRPPAWDDIISVEGDQLTLSRAALLDFGAAGKGYLIDIIADVIASSGLGSFIINAGGDILHRSAQQSPATIGLENPLDPSQVVGTVTLLNKSLCASSGSRRTWVRYHHIIDPASLQSPRHVLATWAIASDTLTADGLATALFFTAASELRRHITFSYAVLNDQMQLAYSKDFPVTLCQPDHHEVPR
jgi:thiamine biosynthesis lipoprotein